MDPFVAMAEGCGATVKRFSPMALMDGPDRDLTEDWLRALVMDVFHEVVFLTAQGVRRLMAIAESIGAKEAVLAALTRTRKVTRGSEPARALYELGLSVEMVPTVSTLQGVVDCFRGRALAGRRIGVQGFGEDAGMQLFEILETKGAIVYPVTPYRYEAAGGPDQVGMLIEAIARDCFDGVVFNAAVQVDGLFEVAVCQGMETPLRVGLAGVEVAAIGRETAAVLAAHGVSADLMPPRQAWMSNLLAGLVARLGPRAGAATGGLGGVGDSTRLS